LRDVNDQLAVRASESSTVREFITQVVLGNKQVEGHMTRLRNLALGGLAALAIGGVASSAFAEEPGSFQNRLNGATIGLPLGAAAPTGLYTGLETVYIGMVGNSGYSIGNAAGGARLQTPALAQAVPLLYVPGWSFLGATYSMSAVQAFYETGNCGAMPASCNGPVGFSSNNTNLGGNYVFANTTWNPISLSWNLGQGWFVSAGFNFMAPDGSREPGTTNPDYWTLEPTFAVSYLSANWVASANFFYDINTRSTGTCCAADASYTSGNALYGDLSAVYKFGKWSFGPVGYFEVQTTNDTASVAGVSTCAVPVANGATYCGNYSTVALGGLIGYDFGPVDLQLWVTDQVEGANTPAGAGDIIIWTRLGFRLWAPEAAKPLVAKN
jgi:hypothetical protein